MYSFFSSNLVWRTAWFGYAALYPRTVALDSYPFQVLEMSSINRNVAYLMNFGALTFVLAVRI